MNALQKVAAVASLLQAVGFVLVIMFLLVLLPGIGVSSNDFANPTKMLSALGSPLLTWYYALFIVFGLTVVVALGVYDRLQGQPPALMRIALAASLASAIFWVAYAMMGGAMVSNFGNLQRANPAAAQAALPAMLTVIDGLLNAAPYAGSWNILLWGAAIVQTGALPKSLGYLVAAAGVVRLATFFIAFPPLNLLQLLMSIVWGVWLAILLWQVPAPTKARA
jgi:hypothetical protein